MSVFLNFQLALTQVAHIWIINKTSLHQCCASPDLKLDPCAHEGRDHHRASHPSWLWLHSPVFIIPCVPSFLIQGIDKKNIFKKCLEQSQPEA